MAARQWAGLSFLDVQVLACTLESTLENALASTLENTLEQQISLPCAHMHARARAFFH